MNEWTIYWITRADSFCFLFELFAGVCFICMFIFTIVWLNADEDGQQYKRLIINFGLSFLFFITIRCFIPTTKEIFLIKGIPTIVNSREASKLRAAMNILLDDYIKIHKSNKEDKK